jgi:hypothetical protein
VVLAVFELLSYHSPGRTAETAIRMICFWVQSSQGVPLILLQCLMVANIAAEVESNLIRPGCRSSKLLLVFDSAVIVGSGSRGILLLE